MEDTVIRPTMKFIKLGYAVVLLLIVAAAILFFTMIPPDNEWRNRPWVVALPALLLIWPIRRHIARQFTKATIAGDRLRYEVGALAKSTRNISLPKSARLPSPRGTSHCRRCRTRAWTNRLPSGCSASGTFLLRRPGRPAA